MHTSTKLIEPFNMITVYYSNTACSKYTVYYVVPMTYEVVRVLIFASSFYKLDVYQLMSFTCSRGLLTSRRGPRFRQLRHTSISRALRLIE